MASNMMDNATENPRIQLFNAMANSFNLSELRTLCFKLGVNHEDLPGENTIIDTTRELIVYVDRRNQLNALLALLQQERPAINWLSLFQSPLNEKHTTPKQPLSPQENNVVRNSIWNALYESLWSKKTFLKHNKAQLPLINRFSARLWIDYFKKPVDSRPQEPDLILREIRDYFFSCDEKEFLKYVEFILNYWNHAHHYKPELINYAVNLALEKAGANLKYIPQYEYWHFVSGTIIEIDIAQPAQ